MPVYLCSVRGSDDKRLVRARSQSQAAKHLVNAESLSAEELADHIGKGLALETATVADEPEASEPPTAEGKDGAK